ncbi:cytochrome-c peroxidase [Thiolapillus sp.]
MGKCLLRLILATLGGLLLAGPGVAQAHGIIEPLQPLTQVNGLDARVVALGERLFHDLRLSKDNTVSCAHCHKLALGGGDKMPVSVGIKGQLGNINAPTVYNLNTHIAYFWDGRSATLETLIGEPLRNPVEMDSDWPEVIAKLEKDPEFQALFNQLYSGQGIDKQSISHAIAVFMRSLVTVDAPLDRWLKGDKSALTEQQLRGYGLFKSYGCVSCHQGAAVGGNMYATMGAMGDYFKDRRKPVGKADQGRFNVTGQEEDRYAFKVPSLRMAFLTPPYFHDASANTLEEAIITMGRYQLGRHIPDRDVADIKAFIGSLLGKHPHLAASE